MSHQSQCVSNPGPDSLQRPLTTPPGHTSASHSISGLAQAHHPATLPSCHPAILPPPRSPALPKVPRQGPGPCWTQAHTQAIQDVRRPELVHGAQVWGPRWSPQPPLCGVLGTSCQSRQLQEEPTSPATPAVGGHTSDWSLEGHWELARDMGPRPSQPMALSSSPAFQTQNHSSQNVQNQARTRRNFMETFLWGLVKSVPTPTQSAARRLTHPVLTPLPAPPAWPLLLPKQFHFYCPCGSLEQTRPAGWLVPQLHAAPPLVPDMQVGDRASGHSVMPGWPPQISNRAPEHLQDHSQRAWTGGDAAGDSGLSIDRVVRDLERGERGFRLCGRMVA